MNESYFKLTDRTCDALVLAYLPDQFLGGDFYIPSHHHIKSALGSSLRKIFGQRRGIDIMENDVVDLAGVLNLEKLEPRILDGFEKTVKWPSAILENYLSLFTGIDFETTFISYKGDLYKFREGRREEALQKFNNYWNEQEKMQWEQIHNFMREFTQKKFEEKNKLIQG